jgi:photosystem II stability/assembly factor-like uncharacterized protein
VISVSITGEATTTPRNVSVNVFKPTNFLVGGDNGTINVVDQNQEISNIVYPKVGFQAVAKSGNRYVAVGESGAIITSTDGVNWKAVNSGTTNALFSVAYGSGTFIAAGNNVILKSTNGINWNIVKSDTSSAIWVIKDMLYDSNNSSWIATGVNCRNSSNNNLDTCMTHYDYDNKDSLVLTAPQSGTGWTMRNLSTKGGIMSSVIKNGTTYILTSNGGEAIISMSNDAGLNWVQFSSIPLSSSVSCSFLQSKNGGSLCSGISFVDNTLVFLWANYSSRMYKVNMDNGNPTQLQGYFPTNIAIGITCNGATCVSPVDAIYKNYSYIKSNIDLVNNRFTATEGNNIGDKQPMNSALIIDGNLWMTGTKGVVVSSPNNGNTWIGEQNPMAGNVNGIAFNGSNTFVAVANGGNILKSTDRGNTWTTIPAPSNANLYSVAYGNGTFIAVGASVILSSRDGITWSSATPNGLNVDLRSVNYSNFGFTAVGASGNVWNSTTNGASWTQKTKNGNTYGSSTLFASIAKNNTNVIGGTTSLYSGADLKEVTLQLCAQMLEMGKVVKTQAQGRKLATEALESGRAYEKFKEMIAFQGGSTDQIDDSSLLPLSKRTLEIKSSKKGFLTGFQTEELGRLVVEMGGGRKKTTDPIDFGVGLIVHKKLGHKVTAGETLMTAYLPKEKSDQEWIQLISSTVQIQAARKSTPKLVIELLK